MVRIVPALLLQEGEQRLLQPLHAGDVEVVGRLVQQQQIGPLQDEHGDLQARPLPAAEPADLAEHVVAGEEVAVEKADRRLLRHRLQAAHGLHRRGGGVERLLLLRVVADHGRRAEPKRARARLLFAAHDAEEGRLAGAVGPDQPDRLAVADLQIERLEDDPLAERLGQRLRLQHQRRAALGGEGDVDLARVEVRGRGALQPLPLLGHLAPHVLGAGGELRVLPRPLRELLGAGLELAELALLQLAQLRAALQPGALRGHVGGVVAGVALDPARLPARRCGSRCGR